MSPAGALLAAVLCLHPRSSAAASDGAENSALSTSSFGCPRGTRPLPTPGHLKAFRCVLERAEPAPEPAPSPEAPAPRTCPEGTKRVPSGDPMRPFDCVAAGSVEAPQAPSGYERRVIGKEVELDVPQGWHLTDGWKDDVPMVYVERGTGLPGRQVTLVVSKNERGQDGYLGLEEAVSREKSWQNALDDGRGGVGGYPARFTKVPKSSRTAYVPVSPGLYYTLSYTAPEKQFDAFEPAYRRLLKSFRVLAASAGER